MSLNLTSAEVTAAIRAQNAQVSAGEIGSLPNVAGQGIAATGGGQRPTRQRRAVWQRMLRANTDGSAVRLKDVARIELGAQSYATSARLNGQTLHRHWRAVVAQWQRAGHGQGGARPACMSWKSSPKGCGLGHSLRQLKVH